MTSIRTGSSLPQNVTAARREADELKRLAARLSRCLDSSGRATWERRAEELNAAASIAYRMSVLSEELADAVSTWGPVRQSEKKRWVRRGRG